MQITLRFGFFLLLGVCPLDNAPVPNRIPAAAAAAPRRLLFPGRDTGKMGRVRSEENEGNPCYLIYPSFL